MDTPEAVFDQGEKFQATRQKAVSAGDRALQTIASALTAGKRDNASPALGELDFLFEVVAMADAAARLLRERKPPAEAAESTGAEYLISSLFVRDCAEYLLGDLQRRERLCLVTGMKVGQRRTLERMVKVELSEQSTTCALADPLDLQQKLIALDESGHKLHGLFHSHPGQGGGGNPAIRHRPRNA